MRDDRLRYQDVLDAVGQIRKYASVSQETFFADEMLQVWVIHHLQIVGEALAGLSEVERANNESWARPIIATRNVLVHRYFKVKPEVIWNIVKNHLDDLEAQVRAAMAKLPPE